MKIDTDASKLNSFFNTKLENGIGTQNKKEFADVMETALDGVNKTILDSEHSAEQMAAGEPVDIAQTMIEITKADISFRFAMQVRNKALSAYEEIMRMQV